MNNLNKDLIDSLKLKDPYFRWCQEDQVQCCSSCSYIECCDNLSYGLSVWTNDTDWVIAYCEKDAEQIAADIYGDDNYDSEYYGEFVKEKKSLDEVVGIRSIDEGYITFKSLRQWIRDSGRGFLSSTEY